MFRCSNVDHLIKSQPSRTPTVQTFPNAAWEEALPQEALTAVIILGAVIAFAAIDI